MDGCFADFALARAQYVARLPDSLSFEQAAPILCAGVTTYKGLKVGGEAILISKMSVHVCTCVCFGVYCARLWG